MVEDSIISSIDAQEDSTSTPPDVDASNGKKARRGFILFGATSLLLLYRWNLEPIIYLLIILIIFRTGVWLLSKTTLFANESRHKSSSSRKRGWQLSGLLIASFFIFILLGGVLFLNFSPQPGGTAESFESPNFDDGTFQNMDSEETVVNDSFWGTLRNYMVSDGLRSPNSVLPTREYKPLELENEEISVTWLGHSTLLIRSYNTTMITDPLFGHEHTDPLFFGPTPFPYEHTYSPSQLPQIDYVFISHDHYDHLDMDTVHELRDSMFYVPLGVKSHLLRWGVDETNIIEMDWYDEATISNEFQVAFTPSQHFSGRGPFNMDTTLWGSWVFELHNKKMYFSGDSGYTQEFSIIGEKYGPFDLAFIESGQYDPAWKDVHMFPDEVIQAAHDLKARSILPIHNSKFQLAFHPWDEPLRLVSSKGAEQNLTITTPMIGETFLLNQTLPSEPWWEGVSIGTPSFLKTNPLVGVALAPLNLVGIVWMIAGRKVKKSPQEP